LIKQLNYINLIAAHQENINRTSTDYQQVIYDNYDNYENY